MLFKFVSIFVLSAFLASSCVEALGAQVDLTSVGPATPLSSKSKVCNILDYGGVADNATDVGPAITKAFSSCVKNGAATLYIPPGTYSLQTGVTLNKGNSFAMQIDGLIVLTSDGNFGGNAFVIENANDVEVFSSNGLGAINGQGYITRITASSQNARLFRFISCTDFSIHDIIFVDSPTFHLVLNSVSNVEVYHITVRGPSLGGTDGIDLVCTDNCYLHDIEVTNRDECISVKSPSSNVLIENIFCNQSGGMSIGSLTADGVTSAADEAMVTNITMRDIYIYQCTQMLMIKTFPGGTGATGYVTNSLFENFWAYDTTYGLDIDQYWESHTTPDTGAVALSSLTFNNWTGTVDNGVSRASIVIRGSDIVPITDITLTNFNMWTVNENKLLNQCKNVYGTGYCAATSTAGQSLTTFTTTVTTTVKPAGYTPPVSPAWGIPGYGTTLPIPVYTPAVLWSPASPVGAAGKASSTGLAVVSTTSSFIPVFTTKPSTGTSTTSAVTKSSSKESTNSQSSSTVSSSSSAAVIKPTLTTPVVTSSSYYTSGTSLSAPIVVQTSISTDVVPPIPTTTSLTTQSSTSQTSTEQITTSQSSASTATLSPATSSPVPIASSSSIPILAIPSSTLLTSTKPLIITSSTSSSVAPPSPAGGTIGVWGQCGGQGWTGIGTCVAGSTCVVQNPWYSQCL